MSSSQSTNVAKVVIEKREKVAAAYVYVTAQETCDRMTFVMKQSSLQFDFFCGTEGSEGTHSLTITTPPDAFSFEGMTVDTGRLRSAFRCPKTDELTVEFGNENDKTIEESFDNLQLESGNARFKVVFRLTTSTDETPSTHSTQTSPVKPNELYNIRCVSCKKNLTKNPVCFSAIIKTTEDIDEIMENFFCHKKDIDFASEENRLFYDVVSYSLNCLDKDSIYKKEEQNTFSCKTCDSVLSAKVKGESKDGKIKCYRDKIQFLPAEDSEESEMDPVTIASHALIKLLETGLETSPIVKLYLEPDGKEFKECLLVSLLNPCLQRASYVVSDSHPVTKELEFTKTMQVLYQISSWDSSVSSEWRKKFGIEFQCISDTMFQNMCCFLKKTDHSEDLSVFPKGFSMSYI